jgi:hypothetical protein
VTGAGVITLAATIVVVRWEGALDQSAVNGKSKGAVIMANTRRLHLFLVILMSCTLLSPIPKVTAAPLDFKTETEGKSVKRLLYVGNSFYYYNNSLHGHVNRLLSSALSKSERGRLQSFSVTISGGHLRWHNIGAYLDAGIGDSAFDENNEVVASAEPSRFDTVLMMDCSRCPYDEATRSIFHEQVHKQGKVIRERGANPLLFMTWAYSDKPEMIETLSREYVRAGRENNMGVVPAGLAFTRSLQSRPDLLLHTSDRRHPSLAGTYLAACTVLASVYRIDPRGNGYTAGLSKEDALFLQKVAWDTVKDDGASSNKSPVKPAT